MFTLPRRKFLTGSGATLTAALTVSGCSRAQTSDGPVAQIAQGKLRGLVENGVLQFRGIPYAGSVSSPETRFRAPPPAKGWTGVRDATQFGAPSPQPPGYFRDDIQPQEDCLFLNVWTPATDNAKRPVMVYQHGGGFLIGSGAAPWQDGGPLARDNDVVVVQSNHRLGIMGYLYLGELLGPEFAGNQGLMDLVASLAWVKANIAAFGGDPDNVTIFGESGGGGKTSALYAMPAAAPYFHKASIESPIGPGRMTPAQATETTREVMRRLGTDNPADLLTAPLADLMKAQMGNAPNVAPGTVVEDTGASQPALDFWPFIDGTILPSEPFANGAPAISADKPLITGGTKDESVFFHQGDPTTFSLDEAGLFARLEPILGDRTQAWIDTFRKTRPDASPSQLFFAITTARPWRALATKIADAKAQQGRAPVYYYILDYDSPEVVRGTDYPQGSPHASDIAMKFNTAPQFGPKDPERLETARNMSTMWANFARTGKPSAPGEPEWKPYELPERLTMMIDDDCRLESDPEQAEREFFAAEKGAEREPDM